MQRKIYLLSPYVAKEYKYPPISLNFIKYYLQDHGYNADVIDCVLFGKDSRNAVKIIGETPNPIVGITGYTRERYNAYSLICDIKRKIPNVLVIVGGHHFGFLPTETLTELPEVDVVVRGEGEITFKEVCDAIHDNRSYDDILGISYRKSNTIVHNKDRPLHMNLDDFRYYDLNEPGSQFVSGSKADQRNKYVSVLASRGCPNSCVFCSVGSQRVRYRSVNNILEEIEDKTKQAGTNHVSFIDSSLTLNEGFIHELCHEILRRKLEIKFNCYSRVNINTDILKLMKQAGLVSVEIGLESGSPKVLKAIRKNINLEQVEKYCKEANRLGIKLHVFCMISLPEETIEDVDMTIAFIKKIRPYVASTGIRPTLILPDAALYRLSLQNGALPADFSWYSYFKRDAKGERNPHYNTIPLYLDKLTTDDIERKRDEFDRTIYSFSSLLRDVKYNMNFKTVFSAKKYLRLMKRIQWAAESICEHLC